jgi:hydrogenase expression/formation protein HypD
MKYVDEFRDPKKADRLLREIRALVEQIPACRTRPLQIMEVCGGHTHAIFKWGLEGLLPDRVELVHGPGCPVCVLPMGRVDDCVALAEHPNVILATFGDAIRVPGSRKSLLQAKADGADVRVVYSPLDALKIARPARTKRSCFSPSALRRRCRARPLQRCRQSARAFGIFHCCAITSRSLQRSKRSSTRPS